MAMVFPAVLAGGMAPFFGEVDSRTAVKVGEVFLVGSFFISYCERIQCTKLIL